MRDGGESLQPFETIEWFRRVGMAEHDQPTVLPSWSAALVNIGGGWGDIQIEAANHLKEVIAQLAAARRREWNTILRGIKPSVQDLVRHKLGRAVDDERTLTAILPSVEWDMIHLAMEREYADLPLPGFFTANSAWYLRGHLPCGWSGQYPQGELVIF